MKKCKIRHNFKLVNNHYKNGKPDTENFSTGEWRTENKCTECGYIIKEK